MNNKILKIILLLFFLVLMFISGKNIIEWLKENNHNQDIVREEDPNAFMIITSASEIFGEGYKSYFDERM